MKASIVTTALVLLSGSAALAQISPAYNQIGPLTTPLSPVPSMPDAASPYETGGFRGAQLPAGSIPIPAAPVMTQPAPKPANPYAENDLNAPYNEPFLAPPIAQFPALGRMTPPPFVDPNIWFSADYLGWWIKRGPQASPLVVTGPSTDAYPGALDQPNTKVLYGGEGFNYNLFSGSRVSGGVWFGTDNRLGIEVGGLVLEQKSTQYGISGGATGNPFIARPFVDALTGAENVYFDSQNFADPTRSAFMTGGVEISSSSRVWAWDINALYNAYRGGNFAINLIGGFTSIGLRENLTIGESLQNLQPGGGVSYLGVSVDPSLGVSTEDKFYTENTFYGGQLGARVHYQSGDFGVDLTGKAAVGVMQELVDIEGYTAVIGPNNKLLAIAGGGVYALSSNMGRHFQTQFEVVPQGNVDFTYNLSRNLTVKIGYTFLYLNSVVRPGNEIDRTINPGLVPTDFTYGTPGGPARPAFNFVNSSFWAQGVNVGFEVRY
jgi:hypothetical protein